MRNKMMVEGTLGTPAVYRRALLPFFPRFTYLAFGPYYHKMSNDRSPFVMNFMMFFCSFIFLEKE